MKQNTVIIHCMTFKMTNANLVYLSDSKPEGRDVVFDFVDIVLRDTLVLRLSLLLGHVTPHQVPHDRLQNHNFKCRLCLLQPI